MSIERLQHGQLQALLARAVASCLVSSIGVAHDASAGIVPQHPRQTRIRFDAAIAHDHHARVLRKAHAHTATVMQRNPRSAAGDVEHGVEQRPVGNGVAAIQHGFGLAIG